MRNVNLYNPQCRSLLVACLISSCLLPGCESNFDLARYYKPAATLDGKPAGTIRPGPAATPPQLVYSRDPERDGTLLRQSGYLLIGTATFHGAPDFSYAKSALSQGQKVGAAIMLLKAPSYSATSCCLFDDSIQGVSGGDGFASFWAMSDPADISEPH